VSRLGAIAALSGAGLFALLHRAVLGIESRPSWPPPPDAVTAGGAQAATEAFAGTRSRDAALDFAWSTAATIEPWAEGVNFFPRIFADVQAAQTSVHILMFGWREGEVGTAMAVMNPYLTDAAMIERILAAARRGVRVRVVVSEKSNNGLANAALQHRYADLLAAGAEVWELAGTVVHGRWWSPTTSSASAP
jgi:PLD-like domain